MALRSQINKELSLTLDQIATRGTEITSQRKIKLKMRSILTTLIAIPNRIKSPFIFEFNQLRPQYTHWPNLARRIAIEYNPGASGEEINQILRERLHFIANIAEIFPPTVMED
jgi:hypothetical protein